MIASIEMCKGGDTMWKRLLVSLFIAMSLLGIKSVGHATELTNKANIELKSDGKKYEITKPEKLSYSTENKVALINGKAPVKTSITIKVYGTTDITKKNFNLDKLPTDKDYIELFVETIKSGNMGLFQKQLDLVMGINKIIIDFNVEGESPKEIIVYVYDKAPTLAEILLSAR